MNDKEIENTMNILMTFAQYGFRKTSMEEIANAAGISRQSVYKKFGSKEKCYAATINAYLNCMYSQIFSTLELEGVSPKSILAKVFDIFVGDAVQIVSKPHGPEVFKDALDATYASPEDWPLRYRTRLATFLERHQIASGEKALAMAFLLISAGKGLLIEEPSREQFHQDLNLILDSIFE